MQRASYRNQARVHNGCHYPRSILTALRSRISFPQFVSEFEDCIDSSFNKYYMVSNILSKISANQFLNFCSRVGIVCESAPRSIVALTNPYYIEKIFTVEEFAFNSEKLKNMMLKRLQSAGVESHLNQKTQSITRRKDKLVVNTYSLKSGESGIIDADMIFNCTYSMTNQVINDSKLSLIPLKHELTEMVLTKVPEELQNSGITVMDGPFFSVMPFPPKGVHSLSHVRYTPHYEWKDGENYKNIDQYYDKITKKSAWAYMIKDASRYVPVLSESQYIDSIWEVKTVLPLSENCDSRPILFKPNYGLKSFHSVVGGKIDNIYDVIKVIESTGILDGK